ncbi:MAG TPA: hypothetical protein VGQ42_05405 [Candidatus Dormibacteraeota bacterium]|jgi:hypothetical protein|nr:hypothetical protein [Candidatus Dormibacteraeota bacterium]
MPVTLAHIVQGATLPTAVGWVSACLIAAAGLGIFLGRGSGVEVASWVVFGFAFCGAASVIAVTALLPTTAPITIRLAAPASGSTGSPVTVVVCGRRVDSGAPVAAPDGNNVLAVLVDGREAAIETTGSFALVVPAGTHQVRVELLTPDHHVFSPDVAASASVTVTGTQPLNAAPHC